MLLVSKKETNRANLARCAPVFARASTALPSLTDGTGRKERSPVVAPYSRVPSAQTCQMSLRPRPGGDEDATADPRYNDATGGNVASTIQRASIENVKRGGEVFQRAASMETLKKGGETIVDATKTGMGALVDGSAAVIKCGSSIVSSTVESVRDIFTETGNNKVTEDKQDEVVYEKPQRFLPSPLRLTGSNMPSNSELSEAVSTLQRLVRDQSHEIASLRASIGGEPTEEYAASLEYVNEMSDKGEANVEMEMDLNTADAGDIANLYSFCVEGAVSSRSPLAVILMLISVTLLLLLQVVYAFAFNDSSSLMGYQQELPAFQDPLDVSLFYPSAVLPGTHVPLSTSLHRFLPHSSRPCLQERH